MLKIPNRPERPAWSVSITFSGVERVRCFTDEAEAIVAFRAMARDARERVNAGRSGQARATLSHGERLLVGYTMLPKADDAPRTRLAADGHTYPVDPAHPGRFASVECTCCTRVDA